MAVRCSWKAQRHWRHFYNSFFDWFLELLFHKNKGSIRLGQKPIKMIKHLKSSWGYSNVQTNVDLCLLHQIPRSYLTLQEAVIAEKQRRDGEGEVQYLTDTQLDCIVEQNPGSDIRDYEDLQTGTETCSANTFNVTVISLTFPFCTFPCTK